MDYYIILILSTISIISILMSMFLWRKTGKLYVDLNNDLNISIFDECFAPKKMKLKELIKENEIYNLNVKKLNRNIYYSHIFFGLTLLLILIITILIEVFHFDKPIWLDI